MKFFLVYWVEILLLVSVFFLLFFNLGDSAVERWDEETNILVVRESLASDNKLLLVYDNAAFLEKPPLWYYLAMSLVCILGDDVVIYRLISTLSGLALFIGIYLFANKFFSRKAAILSTLMFMASGQMFTASNRFFSTHNLRSADLDALQLALIFYAFFILTIALQIANNLASAGEKRLRKKFYLLISFSALLSGIAFMVKGPFALLSLGLYVVFIIIEKKKEKMYLYALLIFVFILLLVILPWHLIMLFHYRELFVDEYFSHHILSRTLSSVDGHANDMFFYFRVLAYPRMFFSLWILIPALIHLLVQTIRKRRIADILMIEAFGVLSLALLVIETKLAWYLLYLYPFAFIIMGGFMAYVLDRILKKYHCRHWRQNKLS